MQQDIKNPVGGVVKKQEHLAYKPPEPPIINYTGKPKRKWQLPQLTRKQWLMAAVTALGIILLGGVGIWTLFLRADATEPRLMTMVDVCELETSEVVVVLTANLDDDLYSTDLTDCDEPVFRSRLTGLETTEALSKLPVTAAIIENSPSARPQSGLDESGLVLEAIAEGGITRFLTFYQEDSPGNIGPIRSLRPYYIDFFVPFDAAIAHVGGSGEALYQVRTQNIKTINQMQNASAYRRVTHRYAPHNVYTSRNQLLELQRNKGWRTSDFEGFARLEEPNPVSEPQATSIDISISSFNYNVRYEYDKDNNNYKRTLGGRPHTDADTNNQIAPEVVIALVMQRSQSGIYSVYKTRGSGKMIVFQDGKVLEGTWSKRNRSSQLVFTTEDGETLELTPGQTWITLVANANQVTYTK